MNGNTLRRYTDHGLQALDRLEEASRNGRSVSEAILMQIIRDNADTAYGQKYHFREIRSYEDYVRHVPLTEYGDYAEYIEQMITFGQKNLLTAEDVVYYAHTSGSSGASKMIPRTQKELDILFTFVLERAFGLCEKECLRRTGSGMPQCKGISLMETRIGLTPSGAAHGAISEVLNVRWDTQEINALPQEIIYPAAEFDRRHVKMLFALREKHLSFFMSTFSHTMYDLFAYLTGNWQALCSDLEAGRIGDDVHIDPSLRRQLDGLLSPDPERAEEVRRIMTEHVHDAFIPMLWPDMKMIATVGTATFASYIDRMRQNLGPDIMVDYLGYVSSESTIAVGFAPDEANYLLLPFSGFYEFFPADSEETDRPLRMDQLETGKEYELVLTNFSGFYRYRIGDVIRVEGWHHECPLVVFSRRKNQLVNMYGEKMAESVVQAAVEWLSKETGTVILEYSIYPDSDTDPGRYVILLESDREVNPQHWAVYSELLNRKLCEMHDSYRQKISQKTMRLPEVRFLQPQTHALYRDLKVMDGASPNQVKPVHIITEGKLKRFFFGLLQE